MNPRFCIVISTADRSPGDNYLLDTLGNLQASGVFSSRIPHELVIVDTGKGVRHIAEAQIWLATRGIPATILTPEHKCSGLRNAAEGLKYATLVASWVILLEDDVQTCGMFLESVSAWLSDLPETQYDFHPLCAGYSGKAGRERTQKVWDFPIGAFYGTQGYVLSRSSARHLGVYLDALEDKTHQRFGHDMAIKEWAKGRWPEITHFQAPGMDFVQHVGKDSSIHPGRFHQYPHFGGIQWSYRGSGATYYDLDELRNSKFSRNLATLLENTLDKNLPVYDMGCGIGKYVVDMEKAGFVVLGIEGHPLVRTVSSTPNIFSWDLSEPLPKQITSMPKGSVVSIEVGEHIHPDKTSVFLDNLTCMVENAMILSWAVGGQGGKRHINEMDADILVPLLEKRGFQLNYDKTEEWRRMAGDDLWWLRRSLYFFERQ
jgi:hypothetical protein